MSTRQTSRSSSGSSGGSVNTGVLQITGGVALDATLRQITDQSSNLSPLYISTAEAAMQYTGKTANTAFNGFSLLNNTPATSSNQQYSPSFILGAMGWKTNATAASQAVAFRQLVVPVQGAANPTGYWSLDASINAGAYSNILAVTSDGFAGIGTTTPSARLQLAGNISAASWTTNGINLRTGAATYTDTSTAASGA